jgi:putative FmdB family regulatory protein
VPTYQYSCTECGEQVEAVQKFSDEPLAVCEACGGRLRKVFSPVGIVFKGSGFYRTDSRNGSSAATPAKAKDGNGSSASGDSSASPSTEKSEKSEKKSDAVSSAASTSSSSAPSSSEKVA